jgi:hypothetical protein
MRAGSLMFAGTIASDRRRRLLGGWCFARGLVREDLAYGIEVGWSRECPAIIDESVAAIGRDLVDGVGETLKLDGVAAEPAIEDVVVTGGN